MQTAGKHTGNLCDLKRVGQPCTKQITFVVDKHLSFVLKPPKGACMDNTITITLELTTIAWRRLCVSTPTTMFWT
jgi:hypothetical protein